MDAAVFLPRLKPGVEQVAKDVSDPECRSVATAAVATLNKVEAEALEKEKSLKLLVQVCVSLMLGHQSAHSFVSAMWAHECSIHWELALVYLQPVDVIWTGLVPQ